MSVVKIYISASFHLIDSWIKEVEETINSSFGKNDGADTYVVYAGKVDAYGECFAYVYFPTADVDNPIYPKITELLDDDADPETTPVFCVTFKDVQMEVMTISEVFMTSHRNRRKFDALSFVDYAIEDVEIGEVVSSIMDQSIWNLKTHPDPDIQEMSRFYNSSYNGDSTNLLSYMQYRLDITDDNRLVIPNISPQKYSELELRSEMMRCNAELYESSKRQRMQMLLSASQKDTKNKSVLEFKLTDLACFMLRDSVVSCAGSLWCFSEGIWKECHTDGYIWNFLTEDFINYLKQNNATKAELLMMKFAARTRIMKDIKLRLQDDYFDEKLDAKRHIIRMENGVYDTISGLLSTPVPSDYVSVKAGVPYQIFDSLSAEMTKLVPILKSIFPDPALFDFFIQSCSTFLEGYNSSKVFFIWWGTGNNAKSLVQTLVMKTLGQYCSTAPTSLVTGKRNSSSSATPELCHVNKKLVVFLQEPNPNEIIRAGRVKEMTGNDTIYIRQIFKHGTTMTFKAKIVIVCNNVIDIPGLDSAIRRRILVMPFTTTFLDTSEYLARLEKHNLEPNSHIIDLRIEKDLLSCTNAFMYLLCRTYMKWVHEDNMRLHVPQVVKDVTEDYVTRNNYQLRFIRRYFNRVRDSKMTSADLYELFKDWHKKMIPNKHVEEFEKFAKEMSDEGYSADANGVVHNIFVTYVSD